MRKQVLAAAFGLSATTHAAMANCTYYEEGGAVAAPTFEICYNGVCDITALAYECSDPEKFEVAFDVGWSTSCDLESAARNQCPVYWEGRSLDPDVREKITCSPVSGDAPCNFP